MTENWQSEYLQFALFVLATIWLVQRGSTESKEPGNEGPESDEEQPFTIYLRQRGSAESKPVGGAHSETAVEG